MFDIVLFTDFQKKRYSTKRPDLSTGFYYSCVLKEETDVLNPTFLVEVGSEFNPGQTNYCYVSKFTRWYYIDKIVNNGPYWELTCKVDVLATYRSGMFNDTIYVTRTNHPDYIDRSLVDALFPASAELTYIQDKKAFNSLSLNGAYIVGIVNGGNNVSGVGDAISYWGLNSKQLNDLVKYMFNPDNIEDLYGITDTIVKTFFNPLQYIVSAKWVPFDVRDLEGAEKAWIKMAWWTVPVSGKLLTSATNTVYSNLDTEISHNDSHKNSYLNSSYYCQYHLYIPWIGEYDLVAEQLMGFNWLRVGITLDVISGDILGEIRVSTGNEFQWKNGRHIMYFRSNVASDIQLTQGYTDYIGEAKSVTNVIGSVLSLNMSGALQGVADGLSAKNPTVSTLGSNGSRALGSINQFITLHQYFRKSPARDASSFGYPCGKRVELRNLEGHFCQIGKPDIEISASSWEMDEVNSMAMEGIYLE